MQRAPLALKEKRTRAVKIIESAVLARKQRRSANSVNRINAARIIQRAYYHKS